MGGGIGQDSDDEGSADEGTNIVMDFYIPPDGPDNLTVPEVRNLWGKIFCCAFVIPTQFLYPEQIKEKFKFFPNLHRIFFNWT
jgi:hypothetical protein